MITGIDHQFTQLALENQKDMLAAMDGDKEALIRVEARQQAALAVMDYIPVIGAAKGFYDAEKLEDYLLATLSVIPSGKLSVKIIEKLKVAVKAKNAPETRILLNEIKRDISKSGTVWDSIKATQPAIPGTSIPKSFEMTVNGKVVWVNPNATKHMEEYLTRNGLSHSTTEGSQAMLSSLQHAIKNASSQGLKFNEKMQVGRWELIFSQRSTDPYPVLKHALYK
ncbi:hypothetical protein [Photorhabdus noenieputensis]|uniref:hypothetical protein n=1 Tax=Photorhabdus noenieputensis TaxID=1208607 RepID=UPI001BD67D64|nr:hypothetical protein [Photorhabdus noenieputensis]